MKMLRKLDLICPMAKAQDFQASDFKRSHGELLLRSCIM